MSTLNLLQYRNQGRFKVKLRTGTTLTVKVPLNPLDEGNRYHVVTVDRIDGEIYDWTATGKFNDLSHEGASLDIVEVLEAPLPALTTQEKAQIMLDHAQGKPTEIHTFEGWELDQNPTWNWQEHAWRTQPTPPFIPKRGEAILCSDDQDKDFVVRVFKEMLGESYSCFYTSQESVTTWKYAKPFNTN